ncbi:MAG: hypothetical protein Q7J29_10505 [Stagnimonas sp.]|nr:hypothetical protein [Stagnimonas sp.]
MTRALALLAATLLVGHVAHAAEPASPSSVDARLINNCAARTDARMESMTLGKLEQIRSYEFSLRMAMAQLAAGSDAMTPSEWQQATAKLRTARLELAQVCGISMSSLG